MAAVDSEQERLGFPPHSLWSIAQWLLPFFQGGGATFGSQSRDFVMELERNLRLTVQRTPRDPRGVESVMGTASRDPQLFVRIVDFALRNITIGYMINECAVAAGQLDRILRESGAAWEVRGVENRLQYFLERRIDATTSAVLSTLTSEGTPEARHLAEARRHAFGQSPQPGKAYDEAVKAVEAVTIPVVLPNDQQATLGKVIGEIRNDPTRWTSSLTEPTAKGMSPVEVVIAMLDMLWRNETERHAPVVAIPQGQAESAVHLSLTLVQLFRSGAITKI